MQSLLSFKQNFYSACRVKIPPTVLQSMRKEGQEKYKLEEGETLAFIGESDRICLVKNTAIMDSTVQLVKW